MNETLAISMPLSESARLGGLRNQAGIEVHESQDTVWLRVTRATEELDTNLRKLSGDHFTVMSDGQLVRCGERVPKGFLPNGRWVVLKQWMEVRIEPASLGAKVHDRIELKFVRGESTCEANVIVMPVKAWFEFAASAPQVRLDRWAFAMSRDGRVVVRGTPLPPLAGIRYVERSGIAIEAGWSWRPPVDAEVLAKVLDLQEGELVLLRADGTRDDVQADDFVRATRSAVRLSFEDSYVG